MRNNRQPDVVCFGMITPATILVVDQLPAHNTGALIHHVSEFVFDDGAIIAGLLRQWNVATGLIGTTLGDDVRGRAVVRQLKALGVRGRFRLSKKIKTPVEVDVSDRTGARTYFWQRDKKILDTLDTADLSLMQGARMLYVDWYDGDHILRAMDKARRLAIPVFLNLEHGHQDPDILRRYVSRATICQAVTDSAQKDHRHPLAVAQKLLNAGAQTALVTLAGDGCLAMSETQSVRVYAPKVEVVDGCGAGAAFSAGFIFAHLRGWDLQKSTRFAIATASRKVARVGLALASVVQVKRLAKTLKVNTRLPKF